MNSSERRLHQRKDFHLLVQFRFSSMGVFRSEYAEDISEQGIFIRCEERPAIGSMVYLQFVTPSTGKLVEGLGKVVRHGKGKDTQAEGIGVEFVEGEGNFASMVHLMLQEPGFGRAPITEDIIGVEYDDLP